MRPDEDDTPTAAEPVTSEAPAEDNKSEAPVAAPTESEAPAQEPVENSAPVDPEGLGRVFRNGKWYDPS